MPSRITTDSIRFIILIGMMLSIFTPAGFQPLKYLGIVIIIVAVLLMTPRIELDQITSASLFCLFILTGRITIQFFSNEINDGTMRSFFLQAMVFVCVILVHNSVIELDDWNWVFLRFSIYIFIIGTLLLVKGSLVISYYFSSLFGNYLLAAFGMTMILFQSNEKKRARTFILLLMIALFVYTILSEMRSAVVGEVIGFAFMLYTSFKNEGKRVNRLMFILMILICYLIPYFYLELYQPGSDLSYKLSSWLQDTVYNVTGSRFFSGRNTLWLNIIPVLSNSFLLGRGVGFDPGQIFDTNISAHNLFLFIRLEQGIIGLISFVALLFVFWDHFYKQEQNKTKFAVQGFLVAIMIQQTFSLGLVGGKGAFSIICWCVLTALTKRREKSI